MPFFKPFEIFQQDTTNGLMAALLIADTQQKDSVVSYPPPPQMEVFSSI